MLRYIIAQILGAFIACMLVYAQHKMSIDRAMAVLEKQGTLARLLFTPDGPPGAYGAYLPIGQTLGLAFLNEFVAVCQCSLRSS
jgi:glycerol uptake facilitator-like aquaporin